MSDLTTQNQIEKTLSDIAKEFNKDSLADSISFDRLSKRYRDNSTGQFISRSKALEIEKAFLTKQLNILESLAPRIKADEPGISKLLGETLRKIHITNAIIAANGVENITQSDLGKIGSILKKQYYQGYDPVSGKSFGLKYLLKDAPGITEERLRQRLVMFGKSGEISGSIIKESKAVSQGYDIEKRVLAVGENCPDCIRYASLGWQILGSLPKPKTACVCAANCKCKIVYGTRGKDDR